MRISLQWLGEWLPSLPPARELAERLTMAGLEVEGIESAAPPLPGVVVAEIVAREKHPNADTLSVCQVNTGRETVQIVCGAPNARVGLKAPLATLGAKLPGGLEIRKAKLRGVESFGMLCSAKELGLDADASGLLELPAELTVGEALVSALCGSVRQTWQPVGEKFQTMLPRSDAVRPCILRMPRPAGPGGRLPSSVSVMRSSASAKAMATSIRLAPA